MYTTKRIQKSIPDREEFLSLFVQYSEAFRGLNRVERTILLKMITSDMLNSENIITLNPETRKRITDECGVHRVTLGKTLKVLIKNEVLVKKKFTKFDYKLNIAYFGEHSFSTAKSFIQRTELMFDSSTQTFIKIIKTESFANSILTQ